MTNENIPILTDSSTYADVKKYLKFLSASDYDYHLDDDPRPIFVWSLDSKGYDSKIVAIICTNHKIMWSKFTEKQIWDAYPFIY